MRGFGLVYDRNKQTNILTNTAIDSVLRVRGTHNADPSTRQDTSIQGSIPRQPLTLENHAGANQFETNRLLVVAKA